MPQLELEIDWDWRFVRNKLSADLAKSQRLDQRPRAKVIEKVLPFVNNGGPKNLSQKELRLTPEPEEDAGQL
jgi:hypothetical protein